MTFPLLLAAALAVIATLLAILWLRTLAALRLQKHIQQKLKEEKDSVEAEIKRRTADLQKARLRLMTSLDSVPLGFLMMDENDTTIYMNNKVGQMFPSQADQSLNDMLYEKLDLRNIAHLCRQDRSACEPYTVEFDHTIVRAQVVPIIGADAIGSAVLIEDVRDATLLERTKDEFFAVASHELRTPLTAIRGNTSMIQQYFGQILEANPELKEMIDDMHSASIRLIELVNDFLNASKLEQGKIDFDIGDFDLNKVIENVIGKIESQAKEKNISLVFESNPAVPHAKADPDRVKQILFNLIGNAIKFTDQGSVIVAAAATDDHVAVTVADTGKGIPPESQPLLFKKFQQAGQDMLSRDVTQGSGLGLYISRLLIENMGGTIALKSSQPGKGSTFVFTLPLAGAR